MIITENQRDFLSSLFGQVYTLYCSSSLEFPYGLPGWKAFKDMEKVCSKLLLLNRLTPAPKSKLTARRQWEQLLQNLQYSDDAEQNLVDIVRAIPTIVAKMDAEHIYTT